MTQNKTSDPALMNDAQRYELRELAILHEMPFSDDLTMEEAERTPRARSAKPSLINAF